MRWDTSTQCLARDAMADVEVAGVRIPAGSQCFVAFSACRCAFESSEVRAALLTLIFVMNGHAQPRSLNCSIDVEHRRQVVS